MLGVTMVGGDAGAGSILALAIVGVTTTAVLGVITGVGAVTLDQRVTAAADSAALAGADAARGIVAGAACDVAAQVADGNGVELAACEVSGTVVRVVTRATWAGLSLTARAVAGPPP